MKTKQREIFESAKVFHFPCHNRPIRAKFQLEVVLGRLGQPRSDVKYRGSKGGRLMEKTFLSVGAGIYDDKLTRN